MSGNSEEKACKRKLVYYTEKGVQGAVKRATLKYKIVYDYYKCPYCENFHMMKRK